MKKNGIQQRLVILFLSVFIPIIVLCIAQEIRYYNMLQKNVREYTTQLIDKISNDIERGLKQLDSTLLDVLYDDATAQLLLDPDNGAAQQTLPLLLGNAKQKLRMNTTADCNILLLSNNSKILCSTYEDWTGSSRTLSTSWLDKISRAQGGRVVISAYSIRRESGSTSKVLGIARAVQKDGQRCGILLLEIPVSYFYSLCAGVEYGPDTYLMLVDDSNFVLYSTDTGRIGSQLFSDVLDLENGTFTEQADELLYVVSMEGFDGNIRTISAVSKNQMEDAIRASLLQSIPFLFVLGIVLLMAFILMARSFCQPILKICAAMKVLESGDFSVRVTEPYRGEFADLQSGFNHMAAQLGTLVEREYIARDREREAQVKDLMRIIDPHFMYNTLEAISMTAYLNEDHKTVSMLGHLASMYRYSSSGGQKTTLRKTLKYVEDYLYLMNIRCDGRIGYHIQAEESLLECECLKYMLQPLVENCVIHGFRDAFSAGQIWIVIRRIENQTIEILVQDDGTGIGQERLNQLRETLADDKIEMERYPSLAVKNIHDRIRLSYGSDYGVTIGSSPQGGTQVRLTIPRIDPGGGAAAGIVPNSKLF